jgi:hypothetical protein
VTHNKVFQPTSLALRASAAAEHRRWGSQMNRLLLAVTVALLASCSGATRDERLEHYVSERVPTSDLMNKLKVGDIVTVNTKTKNRYLFRVTKIENDAFWGTAKDKKQYKVPVTVIATLYVRRNKSGAEMTGDFLFTVFECLDLRC